MNEDDIPIHPRDMESIEDLAKGIREQMLNLYRRAYIQGQIDAMAAMRKRLEA